MMVFNEAVQLILDYEGGISNDSKDPGSLTKFGISKRSYPDLDILSLTKEDAITIYKRDYWDKLQCDDLPDILKLMVFDCAVNQGAGFAKDTLFQATKCLNMDEVLRRSSYFDPKRMLTSYATERAFRYAISPNIKRFGRGWFKRLSDVIIRSCT